MSRTYNRRAGIERAIASLEEFRALADARLEAGYDRGEQLRQFVILGRWLLDMAGNTEVILAGISDEDRARLPTVCAWGDLAQYLGDGFNISSRIQHLPPKGATCPQCGQGWTIKNCHDTWWSHKGVAHHTACYQNSITQQQLRSVFTDAGFAEVEVTAISNQHNAAADWTRFHVKTEFGGFVIGRCHRLIQIDWSALDTPHLLTIAPLFAGEDVARGVTHVHAWGTEQATTFLRRIRKHLARN